MMKRWVISLLFAYPIWANAQSVEEYRQAMDAFDYEMPIERIAPGKGDSMFTPLRAKALKAMNRHSEALKEWNSLLQSDSTDAKVLAELGECYRSMNRNDQAVICYRKALKLQPENKFFRQQHLRSLLATGNYEASRDAAHAWLEQDSLSAAGYKFLGEAYQGLALEAPEMLLYAFTAYNAAYRRDSLDGHTVAQLAALFNDNKQWSEAVDVTEIYRRSDKMNIDVNRQNAKAYCMMKNYAKGVDRYEALKALGDKSFTTLYYLGISYYGMEWYHAAERNLLEAQKLRPSAPADVNLLYYLAKACSHTSSQQEGVAFMKEAINLTEPTDSVMAHLYDGLVDCYSRWHKGDPYEKIEVMKKAYSLNKKYTLFFKIAELYNKQKDYANAIHYYEKYMSMVPKDKQMALDETGKPMVGWTSLYQIAERKIKEIREESFFQHGIK
jgi:tetratricopeptide (TPR) repeat protein